MDPGLKSGRKLTVLRTQWNYEVESSRRCNAQEL